MWTNKYGDKCSNDKIKPGEEKRHAEARPSEWESGVTLWYHDRWVSACAPARHSELPDHLVVGMCWLVQERDSRCAEAAF